MNTVINTVINTVTNTAAATASNNVPAITVVVGQVVTGKVSSRKDRNAKGILVEIEGNPMAYLPKVSIAGKNESARNTRFNELVSAVGSEVEVVVTSAAKLISMRDQANREARESALIDSIAALPVGEVVSASVTGRATTKSDRNDGTEHCFGLYVEVAGIRALLHVSEMAGNDFKAQRNRLDIAVGTVIEVEIKEAHVEGGRAFVKVSEKSAVTRKAMARIPAGTKVTATVVAADIVGDEHGLIVNLGGIKGFLPESDACVGSLESLTKNRNQTVKVIVTGGMVEDMVKVTRKGVK